MQVVFWDSETESADELYSGAFDTIFRLGQFAVNDGPVETTTDLDRMKQVLTDADLIVGHRISAYDLQVVFGTHSPIPWKMAKERRIFDTSIHAPLRLKVPEKYTGADGKERLTVSQGRAQPALSKKFFSLENLAFQLGAPAKLQSADLVKEFGGWGQIPVDDPRFLDYAIQDVHAVRGIYHALISRYGGMTDYDWREQEIGVIAGIITANGIKLDIDVAKKVVDEESQIKQDLIGRLVRDFGFPGEGRMPWRSKEGKAAIVRSLNHAGVDPEKIEGWPMGKTGPSLGGDVLVKYTQGTEAEELGKVLAQLNGQRSLAEQALLYVQPDGFVHPQIDMLQLSGRWSTTKPGMTTWPSRGDNIIEKRYWVAGSHGLGYPMVMVEMDYAAADGRNVAVMSGDKQFAKRFEPGADAHMMTAYAAWGKDKVDADPKKYRQMAKAPGHGWGYRLGFEKAGKMLGSQEEGRKFITNLNRTYTGVVRWQDQSSAEAKRNGYVMGFAPSGCSVGRKMFTQKGREYTQGPALKGQNLTREIGCDFLRGLSHQALRHINMQVHDAFVASVNAEDPERFVRFMTNRMETKVEGPKFVMDYPVSYGVGMNWTECSH